MYVFGDSGEIDTAKFLEYVAKQLPADVATLVKTKQELAKRQGAITAVNDAIKLRASAESALTAAQEQAAAILEDARSAAVKTADQKAEQDAREAVLNAREAAFLASFASKNDELTRREIEVTAREHTVREDAAENAAVFEQLQVDQNALDLRIKAIQDKVATLNI